MTHPQTRARASTLTLPRRLREPYAGLAPLVAQVDDTRSVDLRFVVPERHRHAVLTALGNEPVGVLIRQAAFIDTPDLGLHDAGVAIRPRRTQHQAPELTVTLRSAVLGSLPPELARLPEVEVGVEISPPGPVCCCSATHRLSGRRARDLLGGRLDVGGSLTGTQRALLAHALPAGLPLADLAVLGPFHVLRSRFVPAGYPRRLVAEQWFLPDGARILELSTRCDAGSADAVATQTRRFLARHGVELDEPHARRTGSALAALALRLPVRLPVGPPVRPPVRPPVATTRVPVARR